MTVSDDAGNNGICTATALVEDNILPIAVCTDITVALDGSGNAAVTPADVDNGSNDNCGIQSATVTPNTFTCTEKGDNIVTYSILDFGGNSDACNATVTIVDDLAPVVLCQNVTTQLNASGMAMVLPGDVDNGSYDNCSISSLVLSQEVFDCGHLGENGVVLSAADISGNSTVCMAMILSLIHI